MFNSSRIHEDAVIFLKGLFFSVAVLLLPFAFKKDFRPPPVHAEFQSRANWEVPPPTEEIVEILKTPFHYFSHGNQSSVFVSEDRKYVLKLFRYQRSVFPIVHWLKNGWKNKPKLGLRAKLERTFDATHLAFMEGKEFTKVHYCHLNLTKELLPVVTLHVGEKMYRLPLDRYRFALQQKVEPFKKTLLEARESPEKMQGLIRSFGKLLFNRSKKNIRNADHNLGPNFGFFNGEAVEIDFGNYQKIGPDPQRQKKEMSQFLIGLEWWLAKFAPEYLSFAIDLRIKLEMAYDPDE